MGISSWGPGTVPSEDQCQQQQLRQLLAGPVTALLSHMQGSGGRTSA